VTLTGARLYVLAVIEQATRRVRVVALREYETHYNAHRPHRGIANTRPLHPLPQPVTEPAAVTQLRIRRHDRLGGLLHEYQHVA
jgi:hypothetical protein